MQIVFALVALVVGFVLLVKGADWFVEGSAGIANKFGIPQIVIGLTIVAMGTSMPEAAVSISAALRGSAEITIGNVVGSNIMNILVILGLTAVVCQIAVQKTTIHYEIPMVIGVTILLAVMGLQNNIISRAEGVILLACMVVYMLYLLRLAKRGVVENEEMDAYAKQVSFGRLILLVVVGVAAIIFGSHVAVEAASAIARIFGISERFIGLTIVAFGTSLPELATSVAAARRGNSDIAVGNIVGSNLFNICGRDYGGDCAGCVSAYIPGGQHCGGCGSGASSGMCLPRKGFETPARTADACLLWRLFCVPSAGVRRKKGFYARSILQRIFTAFAERHGV